MTLEQINGHAANIEKLIGKQAKPHEIEIAKELLREILMESYAAGIEAYKKQIKEQP